MAPLRQGRAVPDKTAKIRRKSDTDMTKKTNIQRLTESAVMLAFSVVLSQIKIASLPFGGSVTAFSMLPLIIIAYRYGIKWGVFTCSVYGLIQMVMDLNYFSYATSLFAAIMILLFDYIIAFGVLGFAGAFRNRINNQAVALALGTVLVCALRYICHDITGFSVWYIFAEGELLKYVLTYNASYMLPEALATSFAAVAISAFLDFKSADITKKRSQRQEKNRCLTAVSVKTVSVMLMISGFLYGVYGLIDAYLAGSEANTGMTGRDFVITILASVVTAVIIYSAGEIVQILHDIRENTSPSGSEGKDG